MQDYKEDPHGIIPVGWKTPCYEVVGFCDPAGKSVLSLMVQVKYPNYVENSWGHSTTLCYIIILRDYLTQVDPMELFKAQDAWREKKIAQFLREGDDGEG